jgi:hypothetical protein
MGQRLPSPGCPGIANALSVGEQRGLIGELVGQLRMNQAIPVLRLGLQLHQHVDEFAKVALPIRRQPGLLGEISRPVQVDLGRRSEAKSHFAPAHVPDDFAGRDPKSQSDRLLVSPFGDLAGDPLALAVRNRALHVVVDQRLDLSLIDRPAGHSKPIQHSYKTASRNMLGCAPCGTSL